MDSHISLNVIFDVPENQDIQASIDKLYAKTKSGTKDCLYYGFAKLGNKVMCKEGYTGAAGVLAHMKYVKEDLDALITQIGNNNVTITCVGPPKELDILRPHMEGHLPLLLCELDSGALQPWPLPSGQAPDTSVSILVEFSGTELEMKKVKAGFHKWYQAVKNGVGVKDNIFYGWATNSAGTSVFCRETYKNAEGILSHGADLAHLEELPHAMKFLNRLDVVGPKVVLDLLRPKLAKAPNGTFYWDLDIEAFWL